MTEGTPRCASRAVLANGTQPEHITLIHAAPSSVAFALQELWDSRNLVFLFVWRDLKSRYKQTLLGAIWAVLQPLSSVAVLSFVFHRVARLSSQQTPYPVLVLCGLLPWQLVSQGVARGSNSLVSDRYLLTRIFVPRMVFPIAAVLSGIPDFCVAFLAGMAVFGFYGFAPTSLTLQVIPLLILALMTAVCLGLLLAPLQARYRDVGYLIPFFTQLWFFLSPVAYPTSLVPARLRFLYFLNPMAGIIEGFRQAITGQAPLLGQAMPIATGIVSIALVVGIFFFQRMDRSLVDVV